MATPDHTRMQADDCRYVVQYPGAFADDELALCPDVPSALVAMDTLVAEDPEAEGGLQVYDKQRRKVVGQLRPGPMAGTWRFTYIGLIGDLR